MYISKSGHEIYFNWGGKDEFQVSIIENRNAYPMGDIDYFNIVKKYYHDENRIKINYCLNFLARTIDKDAGNFYETFSMGGQDKTVKFDITKNTFGYDNDLLKQNLGVFKSGYTKLNFKDDYSELEEALVIIYLAMVAEWYYGFAYGRIDIGRRSKWQHRIKLLGLFQVLHGNISPHDAANWSKGKGVRDIAQELKKYHINNHPLRII